MDNKGKQTILIAEDDEMISRACADWFKKAGYSVKVVNDGAAVIKYIEQKLPSLMLLDLMLPELSGEQVLKTLNDNGLIKKIPVIVLSAKGDNASMNNCLSMGAKDYLVKSNFSLAGLSKLIKKYI